MFLIKFLVLAFSLAIFVEDISSRSVHWFLFPLLYLALLGADYFSSHHWTIALRHSIYNSLFIVLQLGILTLYFSIKKKKIINITDGLLGWGDILFWVCISCFFSPVIFLLYYIGSLIFVLLIWGAVSLFSNKTNRHIPLAGLQALVFALLFVIAWFKPAVKLGSDEWIINKMFF
jgi:hypothetical protein